MNTDKNMDAVAEAVIGAAFEVSNILGAGFLEKVYRRAMEHELGMRGLRARPEAAYAIMYKGYTVGRYFADLIVEDSIVVELKCVDSFSSEHIAQCLNYLKASHLRLALLINFQKPKVEVKRIVYG